ncbi:hypothetical protein [Micromonospora sp. NBRC 101691]|uniref:hypothetical protein n=1 Tax=Micromonospora sp. NBRC 101691 TaxID=3032198 RepID=UPI0024A1D08C|nr:hypothetical protein [Micromonospora sp. NBRC 101691]GLY25994.1 hypothetical protein Misp04_57250 [Micromonospora sp. NBRC 101691]
MNLREYLDSRSFTVLVVIPPDIDTLLRSVNQVVVQSGTTVTGVVTLSPALPGFLSFTMATGHPVVVTLQGTPSSWRVDVALSGTAALFYLPTTPPLVPAEPRSSGTGAGRQEWLEPVAGRLRVDGELVVRVTGAAGQSAKMRLLPKNLAENELITVRLSPSAMLFGTTGVGMSVTDGVILIDDNPAVSPNGLDPAWRGLSIPELKLYVPRGVPLAGGTTVTASLALTSPAGVDATATVRLPAADGRPELTAVVQWRDPAATRLGDLLPTLIEIVALLPVDGMKVPAVGEELTVGGGAPTRLRVRYARDPRQSPVVVGFTAALEADGDQGLITVRADPQSSVAPKAVITAAALATAVMADAPKPPPRPGDDGSGALLHDLLVAALGLSAVLTQQGRVVVHGVTIGYSTASVFDFTVDYSADIVVKPLTVGGGNGFGVSMDPARPMRVRFHGVRLRVDMNASGLDRYTLDYRSARVDVEDPGGWQVAHLGSLFDVLGTRSGKGSNWFEVDLAFALDLGPVRVEGATIRATVSGGSLDVTLRGLAVTLAFPGAGGGLDVIEGRGQLRIVSDATTGRPITDIRLAASVPPLNLAADAYLMTADHGPDGNQILVVFAIDLPGPVPLGPTGLGVFGFLGVFGTNTAITLRPGDDIVVQQLSWDPRRAGDTRFAPGSTTLGIGAVLGTVPDLGFTFSARAMFALSVPDVAVNASLKGTLLAPRARLSEVGTAPDGDLINYLGGLAYGDDGLTIGLRGSYRVPVLFDLTVPVGAHFPRHSRDWFLRVGGDNKLGRGAPVLLTILPDILDEHAWAFFMVAGNGLPDLFDDGRDLGGYSVGMGAGWHRDLRFGPLGLEMSASVVAGIGTMPYPDEQGQSLVLAADGRLSGSLDLGPVSVAASAALKVQVGPGLRHMVDFHVCGEVDLVFFSIGGCVDFHLGDEPGPPPTPLASPLTGVALSDRNGRTVAEAATDPDDAPVVWPDVVPVLAFSVGPRTEGTPSDLGPFRLVDPHPSTGEAGTSELRYQYVLTHLTMVSVTADGETTVPGNPDATWWIPAADQNSPNPLTTARHLSLLSTDPVPWLQTLADGGVSLPEDPLVPLRNLCGPAFTAQAGWLLGVDARRTAAGWEIPPEAGSASRFRGRLAARVTVTLDGEPLRASWFASVGLPAPVNPGGPRKVAAATPDRTFSGGLLLPHPLQGEWRIATGAPMLALAQFTFDEPIAQFRVWLRVRTTTTEDTIRVYSLGTSAQWTRAQTLNPDPSHRVYCYTPPSNTLEGGFRLYYHARSRVEVLGVRGINLTAQNDAAAVSASRAQAAAAGRAEAERPLDDGTNLLRPGTLYKISNTMMVRGPEGEKALPGTDYYFRTAPESGTRSVPPQFAVSAFAPIFRTVDRFDPTYLERYLLGYLPGDGTRFWYHDDPVAASFTRKHITALAGRYGYDTLLRLRRTDTQPAAAPPPDLVTARLVTLLGAWQLARPDQRLHTLALESSGACRRPAVGASLVPEASLEPNATYDLATWFRRQGQTTGGVGLPGVVFTTSRYASALEQFTDLGFVSTGTAGLAGDLAVSAPTTLPPPGVGDGVFARVLRDLGLDLRPAPRARTSALWIRSGSGWLLSGVLLESPEPLERPDMGREPGADGNAPPRVRLGSLSAPNPFNQVWRDGSGCRVLLRTTSPAVPSAGLRLSIEENRPLATGGTTTATTYLLCSCNTTPRFAQEI